MIPDNEKYIRRKRLTLADMQGEFTAHLTLITDGAEIEHARELIGFKEDFGFLLVDTERGDYNEVWGGYGSVPLLSKTVFRVVPDVIRRGEII